jgi:hypothetical protein
MERLSILLIWQERGHRKGRRVGRYPPYYVSTDMALFKLEHVSCFALEVVTQAGVLEVVESY